MDDGPPNLNHKEVAEGQKTNGIGIKKTGLKFASITYSDELKKECVEKVKNGASYYGVAKEYNIAMPTIRYWCLRAGFASKHEGAKSPIKQVKYNEVLRILKSGVCIESELCERAGISIDSLRRFAKRKYEVKFLRIVGAGNGRSRKYSIYDMFNLPKERVYYINEDDTLAEYLVSIIRDEAVHNSRIMGAIKIRLSNFLSKTFVESVIIRKYRVCSKSAKTSIFDEVHVVNWESIDNTYSVTLDDTLPKAQSATEEEMIKKQE